jgi:catechol 2,3-dioxygenase-like lactoylglutathione lyase family enzyme
MGDILTFKMDHIVINVIDIDRMLKFYTEVLLLPGERLEEFRDHEVPFPSVRLNKDTIIDLFPKTLWEKTGPEEVCRPNLNHFCLATDKDSWEKLPERLQQHGVEIDDGPSRRWGAHGAGLSIYFRDPEENIIEVRYYDEGEPDAPCLLPS